MINGIKNNISFNGAFIVNGTKAEKDGFVNFMKNEVAMLDEIGQTCPMDTYQYNGSTVVLTSLDCDEVKSPLDLPEYIKSNKLINADEFYDKKKKDTLPGIVDVDVMFGSYQKVISRMRQGLTTYIKRTFPVSEYRKDKYLTRLDFKKPVNILDAFDIVGKLTGGAKTKTHLNTHDYRILKKVIETDPKFRELNVIGVAGAGMFSIVFNIDKDKVLKLSTAPCYPKKFESFDLPALDKGWMRKDCHTVYYCILPKGQNSNEYRLTKRDVNKVIDTIWEKGYETTDITYNHFDQIVKYNHKPYLCDYDCAMPKSGKGRLFEAPKPTLKDYYPEFYRN